jgi:hypothetical protein
VETGAKHYFSLSLNRCIAEHSFALHFASLIPDGTTNKNVKDFIKVKVDILWQGDPLSCVKTFGTRNFKL